ncbi:hypothetical protein H1235_05265 [Pseudoxanthomonas sp. NC8]|nr:hypothetical protein H1235_05265 [Pseudoxanthomonas sp. NC8]
MARDGVGERQPVLASYLNFLTPLAVGLLLLVLMLSSIEIRRIPGAAGAAGGPDPGGRAVRNAAGRGPSGRRVRHLAHAFDDMERHIRRQMDTLRTLSEIDRLILERVPSAAVIDMVVARIHEITGVAGVGMSLPGVDPRTPRRHFLRMRGQRQVESASGLQDPMHEAAYALEPGCWTAMREVGSGFRQHGVDKALVLAQGIANSRAHGLPWPATAARSLAIRFCSRCASWLNASPSRWR